jgi:hypothetical protein
MQPGNRTTFVAQNDHVLDLRDGLKFLKNLHDGIALLKKIGMSGFVAKSFKHEWTEVALAGRKETVTLADGTGTSLTVADAYIYQVNDLIRIESEIVRVTALAGATTLTIVRAYAGTTGAAHAAKPAFNLGSAEPENSDAPAGRSATPSRLYNYVQTFSTAVDMSNDEIAQLSTAGNYFNSELKRRFVEQMQRFGNAFYYGVRYEDTTNKIHVMGGMKYFVTTNVTNVAGALTIATIDALIKLIVDAGGDPKVIVVGTKQKQKLDGLDANVVRTGKRNSDQVGGNNISQTWQSGILDHELDVIVDMSLDDAELWVIDTDMVNIGALVNNDIDGHWAVTDASTPGKDGRKKVLRGKYTLRVEQEKAHGYLYGLT